MLSNMRRTTSENESTTYPLWVGFIFIFNLIVGTGALTLPAAFAKAGWLLSLIAITMLAIISYITATFVIEAMACANAVRNWQDLQALRRGYSFDHDERDDSGSSGEASEPLLSSASTHQKHEANTTTTTTDRSRLERIPINAAGLSFGSYKLDKKIELSEMAALFFNDIGRMLFYICITIYLYGDLSIYSTAVAKSLRDIICDTPNNTQSLHSTSFYYWLDNNNNDSSTACWEQKMITRLSVYRLFLIGFTLVLGPFAAFTVHKTKYLQMFTVICRWLAFIFMISIALKILCTKGVQGHPAALNISGVPALFGACVYSFMCHHSLPSLLALIRNKSKLHTVLSYDYLLICSFYILLALTGIFAFSHLEDLYTLNFIPTSSDRKTLNFFMIIDYFLALFPVFTLSASYPIISITLRNNLQSIFLDMTRFETYNYFMRNILFPACAVLPPFIITFFTENLTSLVAFTGSYAGAGIQYILPIALVYTARSTCKELLGSGIINEYQSKFRHVYWLIFILFWALACMCLVTINFFIISS